MLFAVFFRNLNLGRPPAPTREQLEQSFLAAGAVMATSFLTNGNLVFEASSASRATKIVSAARAHLLTQLGFDEPAFVRELSYLQDLVAQEPFAGIDIQQVYECCVTFFDADIHLGPAPAQKNAKGDVVVVNYTKAEMLSVCYKFGASPGSPNAFAERQFDVQSSTRSWSTICRLVKKCGEVKK